jgi:hypothetical protein
MKGARAVPAANTIKAPNNRRHKMMGNSQYFLRTRKKPHKSRMMPIVFTGDEMRLGETVLSFEFRVSVIDERWAFSFQFSVKTKGLPKTTDM